MIKIAIITVSLQLLEQGNFLIYDQIYDSIPKFKDICIKDSDGNLIKIVGN